MESECTVTNYKRGRALEYAVQADLQNEGFETLRSAGSHGAADIVAFKPGQVVFVQCKLTGNCPPSERAALLRLAALVVGVPIVAARPLRQRIQYRQLTGTGPHDHRSWSPDLTAEG
jgi:Holliday junction resolvase